MQSTRQLLITSTLLAAAGLSIWLAVRYQPGHGADDGATRHDPDYYMVDFTATRMDEHGSPRHRLQAERLTHYPDDDSTDLRAPVLTQYPAVGEPWVARSERGHVSADGTEVVLQGAVWIHRAAGAGKPEATVLTRDLLARPDDDYVETTQPVTLAQGEDITKAVGMRGRLEHGQLELLSKVRGVYAPNAH